MDLEVTPRSLFSIEKNRIDQKTLSIVTFLGDNTVQTITMVITDSDDTDVTSTYGKGVSESSGVVSFGVYGSDTGTFLITFQVTCDQTTPDGTDIYFEVELVMKVVDTSTSASSSTAEDVESFALSSLNDTKIALDIDLGTATDDTLLVHLINNVTYIIERRCKRRFYATSYTNELYDGTGSPYLFLRNYPVNTVGRLAIKANDAIRVTCTSTTTTATVSVTSAAVVLVKDGSTVNTATFASYTTLNDMVTQINTNSGWSAELLSSNYSSYQSSELLKRFGANAIDSNYVYLKIPDEAEDDFEVYESEGIIYYPAGFPRGIRNIIVTHNSGFSTIPSDIREVCNLAVRELYNVSKNEGGLKSEHIGNYSYTFESLPEKVQKEIDKLISLRRRMRF